METERIARAFIDRTLAKAEFTHEAHLRVGLWHVLHHPGDEALELLRERIRAFNESVGGVNTPEAGYHETISASMCASSALFSSRWRRPVRWTRSRWN